MYITKISSVHFCVCHFQGFKFPLIFGVFKYLLCIFFLHDIFSISFFHRLKSSITIFDLISTEFFFYLNRFPFKKRYIYRVKNLYVKHVIYVCYIYFYYFDAHIDLFTMLCYPFLVKIIYVD